MSDIKLFRIADREARELEGRTVALEKSLQNRIEKHLDTLLGVTFLATEYSTGKAHGGRIDTLGIDENNCPVIIEYKRSLNENVINQGLFYLDWLMDHKDAFVLRVRDTVSKDRADKIDWTSPRLICIAGDFTRYDEHAVQQMNHNIELIRYKSFGEDLLLLELVNAVTSSNASTTPVPKGQKKSQESEQVVLDYLGKCSPQLQDVWHALEDYVLSLGDDVQKKVLKWYLAFKKIRNFVCVEVYPKAERLSIYLKLKPDEVHLIQGFTKDVSGSGHWGTGDLQVNLHTMEDLERAKPLILKSYEVS